MNIFYSDFLLLKLLLYIGYDEYISLLLVCSGVSNAIKTIVQKLDKFLIYKQLGERLLNNGCVIFGGYVRDMINGECPRDIDLIVPNSLCKSLYNKIKDECSYLNIHTRREIDEYVKYCSRVNMPIPDKQIKIIKSMMRYISEKLFENDDVSNEEVYNRERGIQINVKYLSSLLKDILGNFLKIDVLDVSMYYFPDIMFKYVVFFNGIFINLDVKYTWTQKTSDFKCNNLYTFIKNKKTMVKTMIDTFSVEECESDVKNRIANKIIDGRIYDLGARTTEVKLYDRFNKMKILFPHCEKVHVNETKGYESVSRIKKMLDKKYTVVGLPSGITGDDIVPRESCYRHCCIGALSAVDA